VKNTLLVTAASTGLGVGIAIHTAQAGYRVYANMRNLERRTALDNARTKLAWNCL
jgi:NAD(P)-dependent dehydrogenase (short-subunit alcohol dehydrogenase family)